MKSLFQVVLLLFIIVFSAFAQPGTVDTLQIRKIIKMEQHIDSLRAEMRKLDGQLQQIK